MDMCNIKISKYAKDFLNNYDIIKINGDQCVVLVLLSIKGNLINYRLFIHTIDEQ